MALMYCKKCGRLVQDIHKCDVCSSKTYQVPREWLISDTCPLIKFDLKEQFIEEFIKSSPEFDQTLFEKRDKILAERSAEEERIMQNVVKCTYCGSTNVRKLSALSSGVLIRAGLFGLSSGRIGKQFHCNHCGADF